MTKEEERLTKICHDYSMIVSTLYRDLSDAKERINDLDEYSKKLKSHLVKSENAKGNWRNLARQLKDDLSVQLGRNLCDEQPIAS
jgi:DNA repair ATPase RecN